jgi:hypothetical protein
MNITITGRPAWKLGAKLGIFKLQDLIDEIITKQNLIAEKVLNMEP